MESYKILMVGPPLAGKGTQCEIVANRFGLKHISSGDILREEMKKETPLSKYIRDQLNSGLFVSDSVIRDLVNLHINKVEGGFILDGYPRTVEQLDSITFSYDKIFYLDTPMEYIMDRVEGRMSHPPSGRIYHTKYNPPKVEGKDDITGEDLVKREDDKIELIKRRVLDFIEKTSKVIERAIEMNKLARIDGAQPKESITQMIFSEIERIKQ
ncbi:adenylate kinase [Nematocida minor]|uniref:adenylate kinase n=1 Tax=Nematocida minor TaxID=1912983 RepID=UPI00221FE313|nr:adenylate kinase [Nematocida minor]KAI5189423.1 adenylate kinase [Nematocida minor]